MFPPRPSVNKFIPLVAADNTVTTKGGYKVIPGCAYPLWTSSDDAKWAQFASSSSPKEVMFGSNAEHQLYCHLLCGLRNFDLIDGIRAPYAKAIVRAFSILESKWEQLCNDLENGFPTSEISDVALRNSVIEVLGGPQLELSKRVRSICSQEKSWGGIVYKLWPNIRYIKTGTTGSMKEYYPKLQHYAGEISLLGGDYFTPECIVGINLDITQPPETTRYVLLPTAAYFEFLPFDPDHLDTVSEKTVDFSGVEVGKMYELVVTTYRGLYRYRMGDVVKVVGFYNSSPQVEYVLRATSAATESSQIVMKNDLVLELKDLK